MHGDDIRTRKAVIIGAGRVGSHVALCLMFQHLVNEIVFLDVNKDAARAQALDLEDLASGLGDSFTIRVGEYSDCADAHFVILTAGRSRRPGETRLQMLDGTIKVLDGIVDPLKESGFHGILISVSNPADIVVEYLYRKLGLPRNQVFGTGTSLDSARLRRVLSETIDVSSRQTPAPRPLRDHRRLQPPDPGLLHGRARRLHVHPHHAHLRRGHRPARVPLAA